MACGPVATKMPPETFAFRKNFIDIMERVQQAGLEHLEHVKRPHIFSGSWMAGITTHQQLFGQVLRSISGQEAALRVYNLLRPAVGMPTLLGDEKLVASFYEAVQLNDLGQFVDADRKNRQSPDQVPDDSDLFGPSRELQRTLCDLQETLLCKDQEIASLRQALRLARDELEAWRKSGELNGALWEAQREASTARHLQTRAEEELDIVRARVRVARNQRDEAQNELERERERFAQLQTEHLETQRRFEDSLRGQGEEQGWKLIYDRQLEQHTKEVQVLQERFLACSHEKTQAELRGQQLQTEVRRLRLELGYEDPEAPLPPLLLGPPDQSVLAGTLVAANDPAERTASPHASSPAVEVQIAPSKDSPGARLDRSSPSPFRSWSEPQSPSRSPSRSRSELAALALPTDLPLPPPLPSGDPAGLNRSSSRGPQTKRRPSSSSSSAMTRRTVERLAAPRTVKAPSPEPRTLLRLGAAQRGRGMSTGAWR